MRTPFTQETPSSPSSYASRWDALLAENSILHKEHLDLLASFTSPLSAQQIELSEASAARFASLPPKICQLVEDWAKSLSPWRTDGTTMRYHKAIKISRPEADYILHTGARSLNELTVISHHEQWYDVRPLTEKEVHAFFEDLMRTDLAKLQAGWITLH
jgi:hypothetical protein